MLTCWHDLHQLKKVALECSTAQADALLNLLNAYFCSLPADYARRADGQVPVPMPLLPSADNFEPVMQRPSSSILRGELEYAKAFYMELYVIRISIVISARCVHSVIESGSYCVGAAAAMRNR